MLPVVKRKFLFFLQDTRFYESYRPKEGESPLSAKCPRYYYYERREISGQYGRCYSLDPKEKLPVC